MSLFAAPDGALAAVWLDGRETTPDAAENEIGGGDMTLRYATMARDGALGNEAALDTRVCDCCQTSAAMTAEGPVVVYRDRSEGELRDISIARLRNGEWSEPRTVFDDGWKSAAVPSTARRSRHPAAAWPFLLTGNACRDETRPLR